MIEDTTHWCWFVDLLATSVGTSGDRLAVMSDREKGVQVARHFDKASHGYCAVHIKKNVKNAFRTDLDGNIHKWPRV